MQYTCYRGNVNDLLFYVMQFRTYKRIDSSLSYPSHVVHGKNLKKYHPRHIARLSTLLLHGGLLLKHFNAHVYVSQGVNLQAKAETEIKLWDYLVHNKAMCQETSTSEILGV